jgi:4-hydroxy-tetrahydrodipicolinate synthase
VAMRDLPEFRIFTGSDPMLFAALAMGGSGTICATANVAAGWVVRLFEAFERGDWAGARSQQDSIIQLASALRPGVFPAGIKGALHLQGVCGPWPAAPVAALDEPAVDRLRERLAKWDLLTATLMKQ